ncbi:MAG TPA: hypothetical protein VFV88_15420 [Steroidobacteraceae bacterium]|nr:hypothetical protein [Steroidobacteraceae bacterium]
MNRAYIAVLALLLLPLAAPARPLLIPPQHVDLSDIERPDIDSVGIDGDIMAVAAQHTVGGQGRFGVFLFQRASDNTWRFSSTLVDGLPTRSRVQVNGNVISVSPLVNSEPSRIYEPAGNGWIQTGTLNRYVFRIDDGSVFTRGVAQSNGCRSPYEEYRKSSGTWQFYASIGGQQCDFDQADINNSRALTLQYDQDSATPPQPYRIYTSGPGAWIEAASIPVPPIDRDPLTGCGGGSPTISGNVAAIESRIYRDSGGNHWEKSGCVYLPEADTERWYGFSDVPSALRGLNLFSTGQEYDYEVLNLGPEDIMGWDIVRVWRPRLSGAVDYFARLNPDYGVIYWSASEDGRRVAAAGPANNEGVGPFDQLYVFDIPGAVTFPATQQDNFEAGLTRWTTSAGQFSLARTSGPGNGTHVLLQSDLGGDSGATLAAADWADQSIEADLRPLEFAGTGRWFGLVTRRSDAQNYYYVTLRSPQTISLRRLRNGVVTELWAARASAPFTPGHSYRVRLESIGDQHTVFVEGIPMVRAKDAALKQGRPGVAGYRTRYEVDNVLVSGGTRVLTMLDNLGLLGFVATPGQIFTGTWVFEAASENGQQYRYPRQTGTSGEAHAFNRRPLPATVMRGRLRPLSFGSTGDPWIGIAARIVDDDNYLYVTLRRSNQLSLRRLVSGSIQVIATVPAPLVLGQWHDLRMDVIGDRVRVFLNGDLYIETTVPGLQSSGRTGLVMYKTSADIGTNIAYQP